MCWPQVPKEKGKKQAKKRRGKRRNKRKRSGSDDVGSEADAQEAEEGAGAPQPAPEETTYKCPVCVLPVAHAISFLYFGQEACELGSAQSACCRWFMLSLFFLYFGQEACELGNVASSQNPRRFVGSQAVRHFPSLHSRILSRVSHSMISPEGAPRLASHSPGTRLLLCSPQCKLACKPHIKHACAQVDPHCPFT